MIGFIAKTSSDSITVDFRTKTYKCNHSMAYNNIMLCTKKDLEQLINELKFYGFKEEL